MRRYAVITLTGTAIFLLVLSPFLKTPSLFYMSTVMVVTLISLRIQADLAARGLKFERLSPTVIVAGEIVAMRIKVWSLVRFRRPLLIITDQLPRGIANDHDIKPLPIAPSYDEPVETHYEIRPKQRGVFTWNKVRVQSTDSLGLITVVKTYQTDPITMTIHPSAIPFAYDLTALSGWGANQADAGSYRGYGLEIRGVREFSTGDSLRYVHWRSTARTGTIQVKEFETGFNTNVILLLQLTLGSEIGESPYTTLEAMCSHAAYLAETLLNRGSSIELPNLEKFSSSISHSATHRLKEILDLLSAANANHSNPFSLEIEDAIKRIQPGSTAVIMLATDEPGLSEAIRHLSSMVPVTLLIHDAKGLSHKSKDKNLILATDRDFIASLSSRNITIRVVPNPYSNTHETNDR